MFWTVSLQRATVTLPTTGGSCRLDPAILEPQKVPPTTRTPLGFEPRQDFATLMFVGLLSRFFADIRPVGALCFGLKRKAAPRAAPILQATKRADLPSIANLGTWEFR